jgi:hypothetical protein
MLNWLAIGVSSPGTSRKNRALGAQGKSQDLKSPEVQKFEQKLLEIGG